MESVLLGLFILLLSDGYISENIPTVKSKIGIISGTTVEVEFQNKRFEVDRYLGVPYAKPPVKELRFKKPEPYGMLAEPFSATDFGPVCPQYDFLNLMTDVKQSEDCLFLNIYVPRQEPDKKSGHAVMFFIHGGGFSMGTAMTYNGEVLSSVGNVIVVTISYRLGLLGLLNTGDKNSAGNFGLWDQHLALQWVNNYIGAFGGDKERVTIFGESAGALSVVLQMLYPENEGLFRSGIAQSGAITLPGSFQENTIEAAKYYAENMSCNVETMDQVFNCLMSASSEDIIKVVADAMASLDVSAVIKISAVLTIDGEFVKQLPADLYKKAETQDCPEINFFRTVKLMNGLNGQEGGVYVGMLGQPDQLDDLEITREQMNTQQVPGAIASVFGAREIPDVINEILISDYTDWENPDDPKTIREQLVKLFGDINLNIPSIEMSRIHANGSNVDSYLYNFLPCTEKHFITTPKWMKLANHGDELLPVFGYKYDFEKLMNTSNYSPPEWELNLSKRIMNYWANFAKTGDPNQPSSDATSSVTWPKYDVTSQAYMKFDKEQDSTGKFLYAKETNLWRNIIPAVLDATEHAETISTRYGKKDQETCEQGGDC